MCPKCQQFCSSMADSKHSTVNHFHKTDLEAAHWELNIPTRSSKPFKMNTFIPGNCCCHCMTLINCWTIPRASSKTLKIKQTLLFLARRWGQACLLGNQCYHEVSKLRIARRSSILSTQHRALSFTQAHS